MVWFGGSFVLSLFLSPKHNRETSILRATISLRNPLVPDFGSSIIEPAALDVISKMQLKEVSCSTTVAEQPVLTNIVRCPDDGVPVDQTKAPIVLIHGFDSSCLEFRRLIPLLVTNANTSRVVYAVDILGWGFNDHSAVKTFNPEAKLDHLRSFLEQQVKAPCILVGASLGGGIAFSIAAQYPQLVEKVVLIDAQGFIDGSGPSPFPPSFYKFGVSILKSRPLRMLANYLSYKNSSFASWEAMCIGRLHCLIDGWERAACSFSSSGGFVLSDKISSVSQETLVLWGRDDKILDASTPYRFQELLPRSRLVWVDDCGHVPHLEQACFTAAEILSFADT